MQTVFDKLHDVYSVSPKNINELELADLQLSIKLDSVGRVLGTRCVLSSALSVRYIWKNYPALYKYLHEASADQTRTSSKSAQCAGLKRKLLHEFCVGNGTHVG
jgi:hypothetical protein